MKRIIYLFFITFLPFGLFAQIIPLRNPSFEDMPRHSQVPRGWYDCGFPGESPPDTQPDATGTFNANTNAYDGFTYLGLVVRDNNTWESLGQLLPETLEADSCYTFSIMAARSDTYVVRSHLNSLLAVSYSGPVVLKLYAGFGNCDKRELLITSEPVVNTNWEECKFTFSPSKNFSHLIIEANYSTSMMGLYNGNILLDMVQLSKGCSN